MGNLQGAMKKFIGNKNTVTILGVVVCIVVLYFGYNYRVNKDTEMMKVAYAKETIQPKTMITNDMIGYMYIPSTFQGSYIVNSSDIVGKYSNYNTVIPEGSLFYDQLVVTEDKLPDSVFYNVEQGYVVDSLGVDTTTTYGNSIMPDSIINIYVKYLNEGKISYGKFIENISVLAVKDSAGIDVFSSTDVTRTPSYMFLSLPENKYLLFKMLRYVKDEFSDLGIEIVITPNTIEYSDNEVGAIKVGSSTIQDMILNNVTKIDDQDTTLSNMIEQFHVITNTETSVDEETDE